jgi:hypothetical protein
MLIVPGAQYALDAFETGEEMDEASEVTTHLDRGMPRLEREHGAPHQPEICIEERNSETAVDRSIL